MWAERAGWGIVGPRLVCEGENVLQRPYGPLGASDGEEGE